MNAEQLGFQFEIAEVREFPWLTNSNGEPVYVIFLNITNLKPKARMITLSMATYVTKDGEQLEQFTWLSGYLIEHGRIKGNAHRKSALAFHKNILGDISAGDSLYVEAVIPDTGKKLTLRFENEGAQGNMPWVICDSEVEDFDVRPSPRVLAKGLAKRIERLEAFEERLGIMLDKLSVTITDDYAYLTIAGEVHLAGGTSLMKDIQLIAVAYDSEGTIIGTESAFYTREKFFGFDVFEISLYATEIGLLAARIRVFPKEV